MSIVSVMRRVRHGPLAFMGPIWVLLGRTYRACRRMLGLKGSVSHRIGPYGPFVMNGEFAFSNFANWGGAHNNGFEQCVEACRGKRCVLDLGGHIGLVAMPISTVLAADGEIHVFEPSRVNRGHLLDHVKKNGLNNITVVPSLVGESVREGVTFFESSQASGQNARVVKKNPQAFHETSCDQTTVDHYCDSLNLTPEIIKIDVEGAEWAVLSGARKVLARARPLIFLSVHPRELELMGQGVAQLAALIEELGYRCEEMDGGTVSEFRLAEYRLIPVEQGTESGQ